MNELKYFLGREGFVWFMGVVEDRNDPDQLGRVRVRCFGWHTDDKSSIPTDALPWAHSVHPTSVPASYTPKEGDWVVGFFGDGNNAQQPFILGVVPGMPKVKPDSGLGFSDPNGVYPKRINESTLNRLSRGRVDGTVHETRNRTRKTGVKCIGKTWSEPPSTFAPMYPKNFSIESEAGHAFELDDSPGAERVHLAHTVGSFIEMDAAGNRVEKIVKDKYTIVAGSDYVVIDGACNITVNGNANLKVGGKLSAEAATINLNAAGDVKIKAGGRLKMEGLGVDIKAKLAAKIGAGTSMSIKGKRTTVSGKPLMLAGKPANIIKTKKGPGKIMPMGSASSPSGTGLKPVLSLAAVASAVPGIASVTSALPSVSSLTGSLALPTLPSFTGMIPALPSLPAIPSVAGLTGGLTAELPSLPSIPSLPSVPSLGAVAGGLPSLPSLPSLPTVPSLPQLPNVPKLPELANLREAALPKLPSVPTIPVPTVPTLPTLPTRG
jgi:hypothetical protein